MQPSTIRSHKRFETYGRGIALVRAIHAMWSLNEGCLDNVLINSRIQTIVEAHGLNATEWHYWCRIAQES